MARLADPLAIHAKVAPHAAEFQRLIARNQRHIELLREAGQGRAPLMAEPPRVVHVCDCCRGRHAG